MVDFEKYIAAFEENDITGLELGTLDEGDLLEMEIPKAATKKVLRAIEALKSKGLSDTQSSESGSEKGFSKKGGGEGRKSIGGNSRASISSNEDYSSSSGYKSAGVTRSLRSNNTVGSSVGSERSLDSGDSVSTQEEYSETPKSRASVSTTPSETSLTVPSLSTFEKSELRMGSIIALTSSGTVNSGFWRGTKVCFLFAFAFLFAFGFLFSFAFLLLLFLFVVVSVFLFLFFSLADSSWLGGCKADENFRYKFTKSVERFPQRSRNSL